MRGPGRVGASGLFVWLGALRHTLDACGIIGGGQEKGNPACPVKALPRRRAARCTTSGWSRASTSACSPPSWRRRSFFVALLSYGNPYVMSLVVDRVSEGLGGVRTRCSRCSGRTSWRSSASTWPVRWLASCRTTPCTGCEIAASYDLGHHVVRRAVQPVDVVPFQPLRRNAGEPDHQVHERLPAAAGNHHVPVSAGHLLGSVHVRHPGAARAGLRGHPHGAFGRVRGRVATTCTSASCT